MNTDIKKLHEEISSMSLGDCLLLCGQAANMPMPREKLLILLKYAEIAIAKYILEKQAP